MEKERERNFGRLLLILPPTRGLAHNPSMCPDWESSQRPFGLQVDTQPLSAGPCTFAYPIGWLIPSHTASMSLFCVTCQDMPTREGASHPPAGGSRSPSWQLLRSISTLLFMLTVSSWHLLFLQRFLKFTFRERGREGERNVNVWLPLACPLLGTWPTTQACALTGNRTGDPLVHRLMLHLPSHTSQGCTPLLIRTLQASDLSLFSVPSPPPRLSSPCLWCQLHQAIPSP